MHLVLCLSNLPFLASTSSFFQEDVPGTCVGGYRRLEVGDMILVQQLDAVDDEEHKL